MYAVLSLVPRPLFFLFFPSDHQRKKAIWARDYAVLRSSSLVKVIKLEKLALTLDFCQKSCLTLVQFLVNFCKITFMPKPLEKVSIVPWASISVTEKKIPKSLPQALINLVNSITMPQNFLQRLQCLLHLAAEKHGNDSWSKALCRVAYPCCTTTCSVPPASNYTVATQKQ